MSLSDSCIWFWSETETQIVGDHQSSGEAGDKWWRDSCWTQKTPLNACKWVSLLEGLVLALALRE